ncbi:MAG: glycosyltransferase family 39 protein, partial [Ignavibacteria bacterium]|nr:glycosyltransferase family 39 protein [Ignavibacteria bacterium]
GHRPLHWDSADHLSYSLDTYKTLNNSHGFSSLLKNLIDISWYYPPLVYWASIPFHAIFGLNDFAGFLEMTFFLVLLVCSVYQIGKRIYNPDAGTFAAFCIAMFPIVAEYSRDYMLDLPLAAMVAAAVYSLIRTNDFSSRNNCVKFGIMLGLGMLTKWTFILFVVTPMIFLLWEGYSLATRKFRIIVNFFLSLIVGLIISLPWYWRNIIQIFSNRLNELERGDLSFLENVFYYFKIILGQISLIIAILFIIGIFFFFKNSFFLKRRLPLYWLLGSYILITIINFKLPRFSIALLIPISVLFAGMLFHGENEPQKRGLFIKIFAGIALANFIFFSFINPGINLALPVFETPLLNNITPDKSNWKNTEVIKSISDDMKAKGKQKVNLRILSETENFNSSTLRYYAKLNNSQINILGAEGFLFFSDYVIEIKKTLNDSNSFKTNTGSLVENKYSRTFEEFKNFDLKNSDQILLHRIRQKIAEDITIDSLKDKIERSAGKFFAKYIKSDSVPICKIVFEDSILAINGKIKSLKIISKKSAVNKIIFRGFDYINSKDESGTGIPAENFELELADLEYCVNSLMTEDKFEILTLKKVKLNSFELHPSDLKSYIEESSGKKITVSDISFDTSFNSNRIKITGQNNKINSEFEVNLSILQNQNSNLTIKIEKCKIGGIAIPTSIADYMSESYNPLIKGTQTVFEFKLGKLLMNENTISIQQ